MFFQVVFVDWLIDVPQTKHKVNLPVLWIIQSFSRFDFLCLGSRGHILELISSSSVSLVVNIDWISPGS